MDGQAQQGTSMTTGVVVHEPGHVSGAPLRYGFPDAPAIAAGTIDHDLRHHSPQSRFQRGMLGHDLLRPSSPSLERLVELAKRLPRGAPLLTGVVEVRPERQNLSTTVCDERLMTRELVRQLGEQA
jgi:hypothetical protein